MTSLEAIIILILVLVACWSIKANDIKAVDDDIVSHSKQAFGYRPWAIGLGLRLYLITTLISFAIIGYKKAR